MSRTKKSKPTKKFEKTKLKATLDRRKDFAKVKQRHQLKDKKRRKTEKQIAKNGSPDKNEASPGEDMDTDKFFQDNFSALDKRSRQDGSSSLNGDLPAGLGKRKRLGSQPQNTPLRPDEEGSESNRNESSGEGSEDDADLYKGQMDALAQKDPEFYKYLQENDAELLDFDENNDLAEVDDLSDNEEDGRLSKKRKRTEEEQSDKNDNKISVALIEKWKASMDQQHSIRALRQIVLAFRAAVHVNDEGEQDYKYTIAGPEIYHQVLMTALKKVPLVLNHHLPIKETTAGKVRVATDSKKFKTLSPLIKSYASSIQYLLTTLSDAATLRMTLQSFEPLLPYLLQFRKSLKVAVISLSGIWSDVSNNETVRVTAFLLLRRLMIIGDPGIRETVLKSAYEGIIKGSRSTTVHTLPGVNLMKNSAAEIWGMDEKVSYTTGFTHIRQLAIHLRSNITKPTKDSYKAVYNWQFVHSLDFWSRVLSTHCTPLAEAQKGKESSLRPLIYPVVQITLGAMRLIPTSTYFPLRFHLIRSLIRLSSASGTFIPLGPVLLEVLNSAEMKKPPKPTTLRPLDFSISIRAPSNYVKSRVYQDGISEQVVELLSEYFVLWTKSIAFPELQLPVTIMLKRWSRTVAPKSNGNRNVKLNQAIGLLVQKLEANARWIEERRSQVTFAPKDREEVQAFLKETGWEETPLGAFVVGQRKQREERRKVMELAQQQEAREGHPDDDETLVKEDYGHVSSAEEEFEDRNEDDVEAEEISEFEDEIEEK